MTHADDARFMALALQLGRRGMGQVWPNPAVGCVIVRDGQIVGRGTTAAGGRPHAETVALKQAGAAAAGATVYVTLEPCAHHGKTAPCAHALIGAKVTRVVVATGDPDPRVAGAGIAMLQAAGVKVEVGLLEDAARKDHAGFLQRLTQQRPFVTLKLASTLDGKIATATGESQWITGPQARRAVHMMRARHDAVMVGAGTVRADDPSLTVRGLGITRQPVRIIVSGRMNIPATRHLAKGADVAPVWLCHGSDADVTPWTQQGAIGVPCVMENGQIDPRNMMRELAQKGITRVFCEGGGTLAASLLQADVVDELVVFSAGVAIGTEGTPSLGAMKLDALHNAPRFALAKVSPVGPDIMHHWLRGTISQ